MKYQLIPAIALAALMVWCGCRIAQMEPVGAETPRPATVEAAPHP